MQPIIDAIENKELCAEIAIVLSNRLHSGILERASKHHIKNVAVIEKGWIGGGNTGRNTTIIRSNYLWDASAGLYDHALTIWEKLSQELNYNVMFSQRGVMNLAHNLQDVRDLKRRTHANRLNGIDAVYLNTEQVKKFCPIINLSLIHI